MVSNLSIDILLANDRKDIELLNKIKDMTFEWDTYENSSPTFAEEPKDNSSHKNAVLEPWWHRNSTGDWPDPDAKPEVDVKDKLSKQTLLDYTIPEGHSKVVNWLAKHRVDTNAERSYGWRALHLAASEGQSEAVKWLVKEGGADVESKDDSGQTPLSRAAANGHLEIVKFLMREGGADVESKDNRGRTALDLARQGIRNSWSWGDPEGRRAVAAWLEEKVMKYI